METLLNGRLLDLLSECVEEYIKSAAPIASSTLACKNENRFSPATIRNDLKTLEQMGYLHQVYTSGGRVPTTMGYRAYIDASNDMTFAADLINDLAELARLVERIDRKLFGSGSYPIRAPGYEQMLERRQNIYRLLEVPDAEMSALYLLIKERMDGRK